MNKEATISDDALNNISAPAALLSSAEHGGAKPQTKYHGSLTALVGAGKRDFEDIESIDAFIRAERQTWSS